jgi:hypothetical protein
VGIARNERKDPYFGTAGRRPDRSKVKKTRKEQNIGGINKSKSTYWYNFVTKLLVAIGLPITPIVAPIPPPTEHEL